MKIESNCVVCKGRDPLKYCGRERCPIIMKSQALMRVRELDIGQSFSSDAPSVFVGHHGYPRVNVGFLTPPEKKEDSWLYDAPREWASRGLGVGDVIGFRSSLVNSRFQAGIRQDAVLNDINSRMLDVAREVSQASRPADLDVSLKEKPRFRANLDPCLAPTGPNASLEKVEISQNPHIEKQVDKAVSDTDLLSNDAILELSGKGYDENFLSRLLSMGNLGIGKRRRLVPTRWAITAVDDNIGKDIIDEIKDYNNAGNCLFFGGYLGNYYLIVMFEDAWQYELFEAYMPKASFNQAEVVKWATDHEGNGGRSDYANNTAGGYYASRLPILEWLRKNKRQSGVLVLRFITGEYSCPLGVWVVREATRKSLSGKMHVFDEREHMMDYARFIVKKKFSYDADNILRESILYKYIRQQRKLSCFM